MASYQKRKNGDGSTTVMAWVRVKPFKPTAKGFPSRREAQEWAEAQERELRTQRKRGAVRKDLPTLTVKGLADEYLRDAATLALKYDLQSLIAWWVNHYGSTKCAEFGVLAIREGREKLRASGLSPARCNRYLAAMRSCWNWGCAAGLIAGNAAWPSRVMLPEPKGRTRYLSDEELTALLEAAEKHSPVTHAAILTSLATGVRLSELLRLTWADIDLERSSVRVLVTKNGESRTVFLPGVAAESLKGLRRSGVASLKRHVFMKEDGIPLDIWALEYRWQAVRKAAGLVDFRWHDLRHSCASFLAQRGASLLEIGSVLGHKSPSITQRYAHLVAGKPVTGHAALDEKLRGKP